MKSLRQTLETTFTAAAFAEGGLHADARLELGQKTEAQDKRPDQSGKRPDRPRPTLKA